MCADLAGVVRLGAPGVSLDLDQCLPLARPIKGKAKVFAFRGARSQFGVHVTDPEAERGQDLDDTGYQFFAISPENPPYSHIGLFTCRDQISSELFPLALKPSDSVCRGSDSAR